MASAANWYVDNSVASSGNGTSWANAWKYFSNIKWTNVNGGDTIYISGGSTNQTYSQPLTVGAGGTPGSPIVITKGTDSGHNGEVIIDGAGADATGVFDNGYNYVVIQHLTSQNWGSSAFGVRYVCAGVILQYNTANVGNTGGTSSSYDYEIRGVTGPYGVIVQNNIGHNPTNSATDTDAIWTSSNNSVLIQNNVLYIENINPNAHADCWQSYQDTQVTFRNNYCAHPNGGLNNHGFWLSDTGTGGTLQVYNNIVYMPVGDELAASHWNADARWNGKAQFWNNTIYGGYYCFQFVNTPHSVLENNICWPPAGHIGINIVSGNLAAANVNHNLIWAPNATIASVNGNNLTWAQWQALNYDRNGVNANPQFTNVASQIFTLQSTSPAIQAGAIISQFTTDINGFSRSQNTPYDIGAYQYIPTPYPCVTTP